MGQPVTFDSLFPAELHSKMADECELGAAQLAREIDGTSCPVRRARLEKRHAQKMRNSIFHRAFAERGTPEARGSAEFEH